MKRLVLAVSVVFAITLLAGCLPSLNETYDKKDVVTVPEIAGEWILLDDDGKPGAPLPWTFSEDEIATVDEDGNKGVLDVVHFKVGEHTFLNTSAGGEPEDAGVSMWWRLHVLPTHMVSRLELEKDKMTVTPIHFGWMKEALESERVKLDHRWLDDMPLFTATPKQWRAFLLEYGGNTNAFSPETQYHFVRHRESEATE